MRTSYIFVFGLAALLSARPSSAQEWELGLGLGATGFMGDINPVNPFYFKSVGGGLRAKRNFNPTWGVQASFSYLNLHATDRDSNDPYRRLRNRSMRNNLMEFSVRGEFNFFKFIPGRETYRYTPYVFAGLAGIVHSPYVKMNRQTKFQLQDLEFQDEDWLRPLNKSAFGIPVGVGFKRSFLGGPWSMGAELGYRWTMTDHLDNIFGHYPMSDVAPEHLHPGLQEVQASGNTLWKDMAFPQGNYRDYLGRAIGNRNTFDGYMTFELTLTYTFISQKCNWWR